MPIFFDANRGVWQSASAPDLFFDGPFVDSIPTTKRKSSIDFQTLPALPVTTITQKPMAIKAHNARRTTHRHKPTGDIYAANFKIT
jgi:hypothetical protein